MGRLADDARSDVQTCLDDNKPPWMLVRRPVLAPIALRRKKPKDVCRGFTIRERLAARDGWECHYCGCALGQWTATIDHKVPRAKGGAGKQENFVLACQLCNSDKGDQMHDEFCQRCPR